MASKDRNIWNTVFFILYMPERKKFKSGEVVKTVSVQQDII